MLLEFKVKNFRSIKDEVVLSTAIRDKANNENIIETENGLFPKVLKSILITGPNASGKSNVLDAIYFMNYVIFTNLKLNPGDEIRPYLPFKLDDVTIKEPSEFEMSLLIDNLIYTYGFSLDNKQIYSEYLYFYNKNKKIMVFERNKQEFKFNDTTLKNLKKEQEQLKERALENKLYLSVSASWNFEYSKKVIEFIKNKLNFVNRHRPVSLPIIKRRIQESENYKNKLLESLKAVDFDIMDFKVIEEDIPSSVLTKIIKDIELTEGKEKSDEMLSKLKVSKAYRLELLHTYKSKNKKVDVHFSQDDESLGTNRFFEIIGEIISTIENNGILIIDELEVNLHPYLTNYLNTYINGEKNKGAQVIYTTHCYNLLDTNESKLRHDQIWFTQKKGDQSTELFSLADYSERKDSNLNIMKRYFEGRYEAKPFVDYEVAKK